MPQPPNRFRLREGIGVRFALLAALGVSCTGAGDARRCFVDNGGCDPLTTCTETRGSAHCGDCPAGYSGSGESGCTSACLTNNGGCDPRTTCTPQSGGRRSCGPCPAGFGGTGESGCFADLCPQDNGGCDPLTTCKPTPTGSACGPCPPGFVGDGATGCVSRCAVDNGGCDPLTTCTLDATGVVCGPCPAGFAGFGFGACIDMNECVTQNGGCDWMTTCTNTRGDRICGPCPVGYGGSGETGCYDLDECAVDNGGCAPDQRCANLPGSYRCMTPCPPGYISNGEACVVEETVTIAGVPYKAVHADNDVFRIVCEEPCSLPDEVLLAEYRGFVAARSALLPVTGIDLLPDNTPFDLHLQADSWCGTLPVDGFAAWAGVYPGDAYLPGKGSYACVFLVEHGQDLRPTVLERQDQQGIEVHEFVHALLYRRHFASYEDLAYGLSFYVGGRPRITDACSPQLDYLNSGRLIYRLCQEHGFQWADLAPALVQLDDLYRRGLGVYGEWTTIYQFRTILEGILGQDTSQIFLDLGYPPVAVGDRTTISPAGGYYEMVHGWVSLEVSPGAFATDTVVRIDPVYSTPYSPFLSWPTLYNVWPEGLTHSEKIYTPLQASVVLRLGYTLDMLSPDEAESALRLLRISPDGSTWDVVPDSSVDVVAKVVSGTVSELGIYAVMQPWGGP